MVWRSCSSASLRVLSHDPRSWVITGSRKVVDFITVVVLLPGDSRGAGGAMSAAAHWKHQQAGGRGKSPIEREKHDLPVAAFCKECLERRKVSISAFVIGALQQADHVQDDDDPQALCEACAALRLDGEGESDLTVATRFSKIDQSAVERMQLLSTFLSEHYPSAVEPEVYLARHSSLFMNLPLVDISSPMMSSAVDTLCLAHLGTNRKDQRLLYASQNAYGRVLASIMQAVSGKGKRQYTPRKLNSLRLLGCMELADECMCEKAMSLPAAC